MGKPSVGVDVGAGCIGRPLGGTWEKLLFLEDGDAG
jgi:hypothetical protein